MFVVEEGLRVLNWKLFHDDIPLLSSGTLQQKYKGHAETGKVAIIVQFFLKNDCCEHVHANNWEDEEHQDNEGPNIGDRGQNYY